MSERASAPPRVSAIIIFLNDERFLDEAIESVLSQTCGDWELLLVDDGSTDGSSAVAKGYAQRRPNQIRYLEHAAHQNRGMAATRNLGIREARGEFIAFLDSDDTWLPAKLEQQLTMLSTQPDAAMIYGRTLAWHSWGSDGLALGSDHVRAIGVRPNRIVWPPELLLLAIQNNGPLPSNSNAMWRRNIVDHVGMFEESFVATYSDVPFYVKVLRQFPVLVASQCWDRYRQHSRNSVRRAKASGEWHPDNPNQARAKLLDWVAEYFAEVGERRPPVLDALRSERLPYDHPWLQRVLAQRGLYPCGTDVLTRASLNWQTRGVSRIEIHIDRVDGPVFASGGPAGVETTGNWVRDGTTFFLQDASSGSSISPENTLARATVWMDANGPSVQAGSFEPDSSSSVEGDGHGTIALELRWRGCDRNPSPYTGWATGSARRPHRERRGRQPGWFVVPLAGYECRPAADVGQHTGHNGPSV